MLASYRYSSVPTQELAIRDAQKFANQYHEYYSVLQFDVNDWRAVRYIWDNATYIVFAW